MHNVITGPALEVKSLWPGSLIPPLAGGVDPGDEGYGRQWLWPGSMIPVGL